MIRLSVVIPVYNRPEELKEMLDSLTIQHYKDRTEVVIVEDGSSLTSEESVSQFQRQLNIKYIKQDNAGPSAARNRGAAEAEGEYLFFFDSDCALPSDFFDKIHTCLEGRRLDCFGTKDTAHSFFSPIQKAISYSMTSFFTTGGIRGGKAGGGKKKMDDFYPRSYSMGVRKSVFDEVGGFDPAMRYGEDIDFSMRVKEAGYAIGLVEDTYVYHKRRSTFRSFFKQTFCSGTARIDIARRHKGALKLVHLLPSCAVLGFAALMVLCLACSWMFVAPIVAYALLIFVDSYRTFHSLRVSLLSLRASASQIFGYGLGFLYNIWERYVMRRSDTVAFKKNLY